MKAHQGEGPCAEDRAGQAACESGDGPTPVDRRAVTPGGPNSGQCHEQQHRAGNQSGFERGHEGCGHEAEPDAGRPLSHGPEENHEENYCQCECHVDGPDLYPRRSNG